MHINTFSLKNISRYFPEFIRVIIKFILSCLRPYNLIDSARYWKLRSNKDGSSAVLWSNFEYNKKYRQIQHEILFPYVSKMKEDMVVLDIGCGIGEVTSMLKNINQFVIIDAVDFSEMVIRAKQNYHNLSNVNWIMSSAEDYLIENKYDLIISSGCYSAIHDLEKCKTALNNASIMLKNGGILLMIDPWHKWRALARAKMDTKEVISFMAKRGLRNTKKSGVLFWPVRLFLANSNNISSDTLERWFCRGEYLLKLFGEHFWADYKILEFTKDH